MSALMMALPKDHPLVKAFEAYKETPDYRNSFRWAAHPEHRDGSLWAAFEQGWNAREKHSAECCTPAEGL